MRVAVLADVHGNLPALEAVLDDVDRLDVDRVVLLGDIAGGPMPAGTLDRLAALGERALWVHGNGERELVDGFDGATPSGPAAETVAACVPLLERRHRDLMADLPMTVTVDVDGLGPTLFCHATPRRDDEFVTHMPFDRLVAGRRVVNPGSVGMAYGPPGACWALLGPTVQLHRTGYDVRAAAERIAACGYPNASAWADEYVVHPHGDDEALHAFTAIAADDPVR